jgi:hypothetical protein
MVIEAGSLGGNTPVLVASNIAICIGIMHVVVVYVGLVKISLDIVESSPCATSMSMVYTGREEGLPEISKLLQPLKKAEDMVGEEVKLWAYVGAASFPGRLLQAVDF